MGVCNRSIASQFFPALMDSLCNDGFQPDIGAKAFLTVRQAIREAFTSSSLFMPSQPQELSALPEGFVFCGNPRVRQ